MWNVTHDFSCIVDVETFHQLTISDNIFHILLPFFSVCVYLFHVLGLLLLLTVMWSCHQRVTPSLSSPLKYKIYPQNIFFPETNIASFIYHPPSSSVVVCWRSLREVVGSTPAADHHDRSFSRVFLSHIRQIPG